jgi:hypothetical protein
MPSLSLLENLRDTNRRLGYWLDTIAPGSDPPTLVTPEQMTALLSELLRAGAGLRAHPLVSPNPDPALDSELVIYRKLVERLRDLMPSIHSHLLAERARLELQRFRVQSAAEWARASRQTL